MACSIASSRWPGRRPTDGLPGRSSPARGAFTDDHPVHSLRPGPPRDLRASLGARRIWCRLRTWCEKRLSQERQHRRETGLQNGRSPRLAQTQARDRLRAIFAWRLPRLGRPASPSANAPGRRPQDVGRPVRIQIIGGAVASPTEGLLEHAAPARQRVAPPDTGGPLPTARVRRHAA